jgi:hypothetical protein
MTIRLLSILLFLTASCKTKTSGWQTLDFGVFKLKTPQGWSILKERGIDSYVGGLTNGKDSLWFDYGWYSVDLGGEDSCKHHFAKDTVNGFPARIMKPDTVGKGYTSMFIPKVTEKDKFTIWGTNVQETEVVLKIYKSIVFKNSDTLKNPPLTDSKFIFSSHGDGRTLFIQNCASCHSITKEMIGPALYDLIQKRNNDWVYTFLTNRNAVIKDSLYQALSRKYEYHCLEFPNLTKEDVELISDYIKGF